MHEVAEGGGDSRAGGKGRKGNIHHGVNYAAIVQKEFSVLECGDAGGKQFFLNFNRTAHLRRSLDSGNGYYIDRRPFGLYAGIDQFASKLVRLPRAKVTVAAPGPLPGGIGPDEGLAVNIQFRLHQRAVVNSPEGGLFIPSGSGVDSYFVFSFLKQGRDVVSNYN